MHCKIAQILASSVSLANESGKVIRKIFKNGKLGIIDKGGIANYQTEADRAVERLIVSSLKTQFPQISVIGEEDEIFDLEKNIISEKCPNVLEKVFPNEALNVSENDICVWVDPLDGTAEFVEGYLHHVTVLIGKKRPRKNSYM